MNEIYSNALIGGIIIGLAAALMLWTNGRILGVSGIVGGALKTRSRDLLWRLSFIIGLMAGAFFIEPLGYSVMQLEVDRSLILVGLGGLLVGFGTTIGNGCTSGHGVCGISRLSPRSLLATIVFIASGVFTVTIIDHFLGGVL